MLQNNQAVRQKRNFCFLFQHSNRINASRLPPAMAKKKQNWVRFCALSARYITSCHCTCAKGSSSCHSLYPWVKILPGEQRLILFLLLYRLPSPSPWRRRWPPRTTTPWVTVSFLQTTFCSKADSRRCETSCWGLGTVSAPTNSWWRAQNVKMRMMMVVVNTLIFIASNFVKKESRRC